MSAPSHGLPYRLSAHLSLIWCQAVGELICFYVSVRPLAAVGKIRKICYCTLGAPAPLQTEEGKRTFVQNALALQRLLANAQFMVAGGEETVEVLVPRISKEQKKKKPKAAGHGLADADAEDDSTLAKRAVMRRKVTVATIAAAEAAAKAEQAKKAADAARLAAARQVADAEALMKAEGASGLALIAEVGNLSSEHGLAQPLAAQVTCEICLFSENLGSRKAERMISCKSCSKKYHRKCLKQWASDRDLFNWASWVCGACRNCEVCSRTGEPNKLMFCKRCDGAYHTYCQQPPIKQVAKGPFLCPNHSQCHSCGSHVPGSGISSRWFLCYNFCDACGRLFVKQKYCPVCLKVYRDSEPLPMVCCDICEHWVHIGCDGISEERYEMFQSDGNLRYKCPVCRGESYKIKDLDDAVGELWKRRDEADADKITEAKAAVNLPSEEELIKLCPSDDEKPEAAIDWTKDMLKKLAKKSKSKSKKQGKDSQNPEGSGEPKEEVSYKIKLPKVKKLNVNPDPTDSSAHRSKVADGPTVNVVEQEDVANAQQVEEDVVKKKLKKLNATKAGVILPEGGRDGGLGPMDDSNKTKSHSKSKKSQNRSKEVLTMTDSQGNDRVESGKLVLSIPKDKKRKTDSVTQEDDKRKELPKPSVAAPKVVHIRPESEDDVATQHAVSSPPHSWAMHSESVRRRRIPSSKFRDMDTSAGWRLKLLKDGPPASEDKGRSMMSNPRDDDNSEDIEPSVALVKEVQSASDQVSSEVLVEKKRKFDELEDDLISRDADDDSADVPRKRLKVVDIGGKKSSKQKQQKPATIESESPKMPLRLKFRKNGVFPEDSNGEVQPLDEDDKGAIRGQRSKRKRPETADKGEKADKLQAEKDLRNRIRRGPKEDSEGDDCWILERLGRDAISKRIEVFWPADNTWYKGTVAGAAPQKSQFTVLYDDGEQRIIRYGKERVRLLSGSRSAAD